jgi:outer membrane protein TolC
VRAERAARLPALDLVAEYGLLARFNNYDKFFRAFQRNNTQFGISLSVPLWSGLGVSAAVSQAESEAARLRVEIRTARGRIERDTRKAYEEMKQAEAARDIARLDLDIAREQVSILLAQMQEGRVQLRQVEEARAAETAKWIAFYNADTNVEGTRLNLLLQTGELAAALR